VADVTDPIKIVLTTLGHTDLDDLRASFPSVTFVPATTPEAQLRELPGADAIYGVPTREGFRAARRVRWVHRPGTGIDDLGRIPELVDSDVVLTNVRGTHAAAMADHIFAQLLALTHRVPQAWEDQRAHRWDTRGYDGRIVEIAGKTMGIVALGGIGLAIAHRAHGFGMRVVGVDAGSVDAPEWLEVWGVDRLDNLLAAADVVAVAAPLTRLTRGLIDRRRIGVMKRGSYLFVVSRGGIVDEAGLIEALGDGRLAGAGLDVTETEPLPPDSPLWETPNLLISPHASALTPEMWAGRFEVYKQHLRRWLAGEPFDYVCDKEAGY
jgi:phosphoglycerate dehydrogenase-like enzyme